MVITVNGIIGKDVRIKRREKKLCLHLEKYTHQADKSYHSFLLGGEQAELLPLLSVVACP